MDPPHGTIAVRKGYELDLNALDRYFKDKIATYAGPIVNVFQFRNGQSNPTYYLKDSNGKEYVLRKKPHGKLLPSAVCTQSFIKLECTLNDILA